MCEEEEIRTSYERGKPRRPPKGLPMMMIRAPFQGERDLRRDRNGDLLGLYLFYTMSYAQRQIANKGKLHREFQPAEL